MTCYQEVTCRHCNGNHVAQAGYNAHGEQRYRCQEADCPTKTFMLKHRHRACEPGIKERIIDMAINGSGIRDTGRVLKINKNTVISVLKNKAGSLVQVNPKIAELSASSELVARLEEACIEAELDEQWSWVGKKPNQRWLWHAVDHATNTVLAYVFGKRKDEVFKKLKGLLEPFGVRRYCTDGWGAYERHLDTL